MSGRGFSYFAETPGLPLSLKCMANGRALYKFGRAEVAVDDGGYLILKDQRPYSIEISAPPRVQKILLWFPGGWAQEDLRRFNEAPGMLLATTTVGSRRSGMSLAVPFASCVSGRVSSNAASVSQQLPIGSGEVFARKNADISDGDLFGMRVHQPRFV